MLSKTVHHARAAAPAPPCLRLLPAGQPAGLDIYTDHLAAGSRFLSLKRYWSSAPVMDLDFLLDEVMADTIPLDYQAVIDSELPLKVVASSLTTLNSEVLTDFKDARDLAECLKASANVPEIVGGPRRWRGHDLVDAAVFEPLPIKAALRDGCTHVLALCSRTHSAGPAWGKYLTNVLSSAIKYMVLNPVSGGYRAKCCCAAAALCSAAVAVGSYVAGLHSHGALTCLALSM